MKIAALIARILLGLSFVIFGMNGFVNFMKGQMPPGMAADFTQVFLASHWVYAVSGVMVLSGLLFLINRYVPLALVLSGPLVVNILLFHILMAPASIGPGVVVTVLWFIIFASVRSNFAGIFVAKA